MFLPDTDHKKCTKHPDAITGNANTGALCARCWANRQRDLHGRPRPDYGAVPIEREGMSPKDAEQLRQIYAEIHIDGSSGDFRFEVPA